MEILQDVGNINDSKIYGGVHIVNFTVSDAAVERSLIVNGRSTRIFYTTYICYLHIKCIRRRMKHNRWLLGEIVASLMRDFKIKFFKIPLAISLILSFFVVVVFYK